MSIKPERFGGGGMYFSISPGAIRPGTLGNFRMFLRQETVNDYNKKTFKYIKLTDHGEHLSQDVFDRLQRNVNEVFVKTSEKVKYEDYLEENLDFVLANEEIDLQERAGCFANVSVRIIKECFESTLGSGALDREAVGKVRALVCKTLKFISDTKSLEGLSGMIGHDYETYKHSMQVFWTLSSLLNACTHLLPPMSPEQLDDYLIQCGVAALLHDIGKNKIMPDILNKNGKLTDMEFSLIQSHTAYSVAILHDADLPDFVKQGILFHHEDYNGNGYPCGLTGEKIPFLARALRIVDVFDAITSKRPYKPAKMPIEALKIMVGEDIEIDTDEDVDKRDLGMRHCFDIDLLKIFIGLLAKAKLC